MNIRRFYCLLCVTVNTIFISVSAFAHTEGNGWHHHMTGMWGWPLMIIFWIIAVLIILLLAVTIIKVLRK